MSLVANAGPLIALARIDKLELLPAALLDQLVDKGVCLSAALYENARRLARES